MPKNKKLALNSGVQTNQILTNDDEVCIPCLFIILLPVHSQFKTPLAIFSVNILWKPRCTKMRIRKLEKISPQFACIALRRAIVKGKKNLRNHNGAKVFWLHIGITGDSIHILSLFFSIWRSRNILIKGQIISEENFGGFNSFKKRTKNFCQVG